MTGVPAHAAPAASAPDHLGDPVQPKAGLWNIANLLTMARLVLVPGFVLLLLHGDGHDPAWRSFAWAAFAIAMITDLFDGELARRYGLVTDFGKIADPIADKAIMGAALVGLSALGDLPWWVTVVILVRELGITLLRFWVIRHAVIPASRGGKMKTLAQGIAVGMYILMLTGPLATVRAWMMAIAVILTVATGLDYVRQAIVLRRAGLAAERAAAVAAAAAVPDGAEAGASAGAKAIGVGAVPGAAPPVATAAATAAAGTAAAAAAESGAGAGAGGAGTAAGADDSDADDLDSGVSAELSAGAGAGAGVGADADFAAETPAAERQHGV
ncbi:CDP-diacylglycerol--glycerol-3-phosphate 3-phosphatidyltransferase [Streptomyces sp. NPDC051976]|uniref:CDP-diacylglycerol--glycerol-3-phosphate 3-phosphatidyltransferase n=1 Tax=Streptomyces sp. NPDC051976 TaxID=3154947 RepID=UPI00343CBAF8